MEAARQVLKRAAELKILNSEQIMLLSAALVEDQSGSIHIGQMLCMYHIQLMLCICTVWNKVIHSSLPLFIEIAIILYVIVIGLLHIYWHFDIVNIASNYYAYCICYVIGCVVMMLL